jgi:hypothetical protein
MKVLDRLMQGAIDFHVHSGPHPFRDLRLDALELARQARDLGMRAIVNKSNFYCTAPVCFIVNKVVPNFSLIGSLVLNSAAGGLDPEAVEVAINTGARVIWLPTESSVTASRRKTEGPQNPGHIGPSLTRQISIIGSDGRLVPEMEAILALVKAGDIVLGTGHISVAETYAVVERAASLRIKVAVTHPLTPLPGTSLTLEQQKELVDKGAFIEHCFLPCMPPRQRVDPQLMAEHIKAVGPDHCILDTDFGQTVNPASPEGFRMMLAIMLTAGLSENELELLVKTNPSRLLGLD